MNNYHEVNLCRHEQSSWSQFMPTWTIIMKSIYADMNNHHEVNLCRREQSSWSQFMPTWTIIMKSIYADVNNHHEVNLCRREQSSWSQFMPTWTITMKSIYADVNNHHEVRRKMSFHMLGVRLASAKQDGLVLEDLRNNFISPWSFWLCDQSWWWLLVLWIKNLSLNLCCTCTNFVH